MLSTALVCCNLCARLWVQKAEKQCLEETSPCWGFTLSYHMIQYDMLRHDIMCNMHIDNVVKYNVSAESDNRTLYSVHAVATKNGTSLDMIPPLQATTSLFALSIFTLDWFYNSATKCTLFCCATSIAVRSQYLLESFQHAH